MGNSTDTALESSLNLEEVQQGGLTASNNYKNQHRPDASEGLSAEIDSRINPKFLIVGDLLTHGERVRLLLVDFKQHFDNSTEITFLVRNSPGEYMVWNAEQLDSLEDFYWRKDVTPPAISDCYNSDFRTHIHMEIIDQAWNRITGRWSPYRDVRS